MQVLQVIIATVVSSGIIAVFMHHFYDKRLRTHELKLQRYMELIQELSKLMGTEADFNRLRPLLNGALFFASDGVVSEILKFNDAFTRAREAARGNPNFQMTGEQVKPLVIAIRNDLYLKSTSLQRRELRFFQKVQDKAASEGAPHQKTTG